MDSTAQKSHGLKSFIKSTLRIICWTAMALILFVAGTLVMLVRVLEPEMLTPIVEKVSNSFLKDSELSLGRAELTLGKSFPFLFIQLDSLLLLSDVSEKLPDRIRETIPAYADTLLVADRISGGVNLSKLPLGKIDLRDLSIEGPGVNVAVYTDSLNNFDI